VYFNEKFFEKNAKLFFSDNSDPAHAQTDCLQMRGPALSKWQDLALYCLYLRGFRVTKPTFY
jgi:hypothetical protein